MDRDNDPHEISRRYVLGGVSASVAGATVLGGTGIASAGTWQTESGSNRDLYNVGVLPDQKDAGISAARQAADSVRKTVDLGEVGAFVNGTFPEAAREALEDNPKIKYVERDITASLAAQTLPWGIDRIDAERTHNSDTIGDPDDATVCVIDTGIDSDHPDLQNGSLIGQAFGGYSCGSGSCGGNGNTCNETWDDDDDHGTHVAGTIAADDNTEDVVGVTPGIDLMAAKVFDGCGNGGFHSDIADAIRWAADNGADVINMSLGGGSSDTLNDACNYGHVSDVVMVAAAGNGGNCTPEDCVSYPAAYSTVIGVSNIDSKEQLEGDSQNGPEIDFGAPGNSILSTVPPESSSGGTATFRGTSMASPHVAGTAAAVKDLTTLQDDQAIRRRLNSSAENISHDAADQGYGLIDTLAATNVEGPAPSDPQLTPHKETVTIDHNWTTVYFDNEFADPIVVAGPATFNGSQPTTVRVRNVTSTSAEIRLQEWDYQNGTHVNEDVAVAVFEEAEFSELDGAQAETGRATGVNTNWQSVSFIESFPSGTTPIVIPQVVTFNGSDTVVPRTRNVDNTGFEIRLQEQETKAGEGHVDEQLHYLAIEPYNTFEVEAAFTGDVVDHDPTTVSLDGFSNRPHLLAHIQTFDGPDPVNLRTRSVSASEFEIEVDEEDSAGDGTAHTTENVGYVALEQFDNQSMTYETGTGTVDQPTEDAWHRVAATKTGGFDDPVVIMGPLTNNGGQPVHPRVRNIGTNPAGVKTFDFQLEEWEYLNGKHITEQVSYGIFEAGTGTIGGQQVEADYRTDIDHNLEFVRFTEEFSQPPIVLHQCTTQAGDDPVTTRIESVGTTGFYVKLQEEEANGSHYTERVDFLAIEPGDAGEVEAHTTGNTVTDVPLVLDSAYDGFSTPPDLLAAMQTTDGGDTAHARFDNEWNDTGFNVYIQEETSADGETSHTDENVGYAAFSHEEPTSQIVRDVGTETTDQPDSQTWHSVSLTTGFRNRVVVMGPPTFNGSNPMTVRVRNAIGEPFEFQFDEWDSEDGSHITEDVSYGVFEAGVGTLDSGGNSTVETGSVGADENWKKVPFDLKTDFGSTPVVVAQCSSGKGEDAVTTRIRNVTTDGFGLRLQEQEANNDGHTKERVDYIAAEPVSATNVEVGMTNDVVNHNETTVNFSTSFSSAPHVLAHIQTFDGPEPANLRISDVTSSSFDVEVDEDNSVDGDAHTDEVVGYIVFESS